jgi:predicted RNA binding protein YcfA (HicA-like mRNA interferase family)
MPQVPTIRGDQLVKALEKVGFMVVRVRGSHPSAIPTVAVRRSRSIRLEIFPGDPRNILADAGLTMEELKRLI